tara:strand:+ start:4266 stop:4520 length:255 start_codon:yes stop_codon:yes gene_type:complete
MKKMKRDEIKNNFEEITKRLGIGLDQVVRATSNRLKVDEEYRKEIVALLDYLEAAIDKVRETIQDAEFTGYEWDDDWPADEEEL